MTSTHQRRFSLTMVAGLIVFSILNQVRPAWASPSPTACGRNLVLNGSFEQGPAVGSYRTIESESTVIDGWTVTRGSVDVVGSLWAASDGSRSIDMDGVSFGSITQAFPTEAGKTYAVTFDLTGNGYGLPKVKRLKITAADQSREFQYDLAVKHGVGWQERSWQFVAKGTSTTLQFDSLDTENGYFGPVIDNVRVQLMCES